MNTIVMTTRVDDFEPHRLSIAGVDIFSDGIDCGEAAIASNKLQSLLGQSANCHDDLSQVVMAGKVCIVLLEISSPKLSTCSEIVFNQILRILRTAAGIIWVTRGGVMDCEIPEASVITGLARSARTENPGQIFITLDLDSRTRSEPAAVAHIIQKIYRATFIENNIRYEREYAERGGTVFIPRLLDNATANQCLRSNSAAEDLQILPFFQGDRPLRLQIATPGLLETLHWADQEPCPSSLDPEDIEIEVRAVGVNFREVMIALGRLTGMNFEHGEYSGIVIAVGSSVTEHYQIGDRVCAMGRRAVCANTIRIQASQAYRIPESMSWETAASIPIAHATAYYSLIDVGRLQKGESILVHSASGATGQAAIILAQYIGATIFATVGNDKKKQFLMENFGIPEDHIFSSRSHSFVGGIKRLTQGRGVDMILNSLAGDLLRETFNCIAPFGRFIEIGKKDILANSKIDMRMFEKNVTFSAVDLIRVMERPKEAQRLFKACFALLQDGLISPVTPISVFQMSDIETAYRQMQTGKHIGKIVLKADPDCKVKVDFLSSLNVCIKLTSADGSQTRQTR